MEMKRFTKANLKTLAPGAKPYDVYDDPTGPGGVRGLAVTVRPSGVRTWYVIRKVGHQVERVKIARVEDLDPERARKRAAKINNVVADGRSPAAEKRAFRGEMDLGALWQAFKLKHGPYKRSFRTDEGRWRNHLAHWQGRKLSSIDRAAVHHLLDSIKAKAGPGAANRTRALLSTLFAKAREWGAEIPNPVAGLPRNPEHVKTRYLSPDELKRFLGAVEADPDDDTRDFLRLLLFTGVRRGSLCAARWEDLALADALWRIPAEYMKAGRPLELPLAPAAVAILRDREDRAAAGAVWVFPGRNGHTRGPDVGWLRVLAQAEIAGLTMHDLRRSYAVYALEAGVAMPMIAAVLGHATVGGITGQVYARVTPSTVRAGVEKAVAHLLAVATAGAEVLPFAPATTAVKA